MKLVNKRINLVIILILMSFLIINFCYAGLLRDETKQKINIQSYTAGLWGGYATVVGDEGVLALIQTVINAFLSLVGVILLVYLLHAGYKWMTAHGEEEKVEEAKDTIKRAIVGVIIIVAAYAISVFVMARLEAGTLRGGASTPASPAAPATIPATPPPPDLPPVYDDE